MSSPDGASTARPASANVSIQRLRPAVPIPERQISIDDFAKVGVACGAGEGRGTSTKAR